MRAGRAAALTGLVEGDVAVLADPAEEELDPAVLLDLGLVRVALRDEVLRVAVQDVHLRRRDVHCGAGADPGLSARARDVRVERTHRARRTRGT